MTSMFCLNVMGVTGEVRALLCSACNVGLGMFQDAPDLLTKAAQYLLRKKLKAVS